MEWVPLTLNRAAPATCFSLLVFCVCVCVSEGTKKEKVSDLYV